MTLKLSLALHIQKKNKMEVKIHQPKKKKKKQQVVLCPYTKIASFFSSADVFYTEGKC